MKKFIIGAVFAVVFLTTGSMVYAQNQKNQQKKTESEFYYVNIGLEKIYPYRTGYVVMYRKALGHMARAYLPMEWFIGAATKGEIITLPAGRTWPSMSVYYKNGEFSHVRLYIHRSNSHETWGDIPQTVNIDSSFENVQDIKLSFQ